MTDVEKEIFIEGKKSNSAICIHKMWQMSYAENWTKRKWS